VPRLLSNLPPREAARLAQAVRTRDTAQDRLDTLVRRLAGKYPNAAIARVLGISPQAVGKWLRENTPT